MQYKRCLRETPYGKEASEELASKINPTTTIFPNTSNTINNVSIVGQTDNVGGQMIFGASGVSNGQELERKKQKILNAGAAVDSVRMCTICNVACNSHEVFSKHLSGRRHAAQKMQEVSAWSTFSKLVQLFIPSHNVSQSGTYFINPFAISVSLVSAFHFHKCSTSKKTTKINQSTWCEVCKINCNSNDVYAKQLSGKKHLKNLENLEKSKNDTYDPSSIDAPAATNLIIGPVENPHQRIEVVLMYKNKRREQQSEAPKEDLETKKKKVIEGGAAAVRVCTICNVVCNSQKVFKYHLYQTELCCRGKEASSHSSNNYCCIKT
ncbi:hypothetical protein CRYUN_Cryun12cG0156400 [Craigia yunnanensis]